MIIGSHFFTITLAKLLIFEGKLTKLLLLVANFGDNGFVHMEFIEVEEFDRDWDAEARFV